MSLYYLIEKRKPFGDDKRDLDTYLENVKKLKYDVPDSFSPELKDLFNSIFTTPDKRLTLDQLLKHPWLNPKKTVDPAAKKLISKMTQFLFKSSS